MRTQDIPYEILNKRRRFDNATLYTNSTMFTNSTAPQPIVLQGLATFYPNGTVIPLPHGTDDTGYAPYEGPGAGNYTVDVEYDDIIPAGEIFTPHYLALLHEQGEGGLPLTTATSAPEPSSTVPPGLVSVMEEDPWEGKVHCEVGETPFLCIAG